MLDEQQKKISAPKEQINLRIELKFKLCRSSVFNKQKVVKSIVQGIPYIAFIVVTNISNKSFKGASLKETQFEYIGTDVQKSVDRDIQIPAINPKGKIELEIDSLTFSMDGGSWGEFKLVPESKKQEVKCYQFDKFHDQDEPCDGINSWGNSFFVEGKLAALQTKTNNYILALTIITVLEAVFGIKDILILFASFLAIIFSSLGEFFEYLAKFT